MNFKILSGLLLLSTVAAVNSAYAADAQDITLSAACGGNTDLSFASKKSEVVSNGVIGVGGAGGNVEWSIDSVEQTCTLATANTIGCGGLTITVPTGSVTPATKVTFGGTSIATLTEGKFTLRVSDGTNNCTRKYIFHVTDNGGGWGDPHMTTVGGVKYDFQSAGEFTALRQTGFEVQTRQTPVPTTTVPGANEYTGLAVCVSIYTAVAARIGSNRVSFQPNQSQPGIFAQSDPSGMQLRVNGQLVTLTDKGIDLLAGGGRGGGAVEGRILPAGGGAIEITDVRGTQLVATPAFWSSQQKWYLNLNVFQTSATQGIWGLLAEGSWLPALPDGTSLGPQPDSSQQRYQDLYEKFADAWRVTNATSLFDYASGTNTGTFTLDEWPRFNPQTCDIQGQTSVQPTTQQAAEQACAAVTDAGQKANCIFDVIVTGETGFGQSYVAMQRFTPHGTGFQPVLGGGGGGGGGQQPPPNWWLWILLLILIVIIILWLLRRRTA